MQYPTSTNVSPCAPLPKLQHYSLQASGVVGVRDVRQFLQRCGLFTRPASPSSSPTSTPSSSNRGHTRGASHGSAASVGSGKSGKSADKTDLPPRLEPIVQCVRRMSPHVHKSAPYITASLVSVQAFRHVTLHHSLRRITLGHRRAASLRGRVCPSPCSVSCSWCWPRNSTGTHPLIIPRRMGC